MNENAKNKINEKLKNNDVCLFMKGTPEVPQCGFSLAVSNVLKHLEVKFVGVNVLEDNEIREGIKKYSEIQVCYNRRLPRTLGSSSAAPPGGGSKRPIADS